MFVMATVCPEIVHRMHVLAVVAKSILPFGRYPIHRNEPYRPFFIIGSGRSGNTLLRRVLTAHPALHIPPETLVLGRVAKKFRQVSHMHWSDIVLFVYAFFQFEEEFDAFEISNMPELVKNVAGVEPNRRSLAFIINAFYEWHARQHGITFERWGDKTPLNVYALKRIHQVFPKAQFIHIVRDGCDAVASYLETGIFKSPEEAAWRWRTAVRLCRSFGRSHRRAYLEVRYEDLVTRPRETVDQICAFLGVEFDQRMLELPEDAGRLGDVPRRRHHSEVLKPISTDKIGKGRRSLGENQKRRIAPIIGRQMAELGYPDCITGEGSEGAGQSDKAGAPLQRA
jgi:hypothetical protein